MSNAQQQHTLGRIRALPEEPGVPYIRIRGDLIGQRFKIANVLTPVYEGVGEREFEETRENARRLVACWNACEGLATETLERLGTLDRANVARDARHVEALAQRDELLAALETIVKSLADQDDEGMIEHAEPMIRARAVIAKVKGGTQ